jgi:anti-anti-sigma factor
MSLTSPRAQPSAFGSAAVSDLRVDVHPGLPLVVEVCGEVDIQSAPWLRDELLRTVRRHGPRIALDLAGVTFLDCAGINVLLSTRRRALLEGGWLQVVRPSARAWRVISVLGLQDVLTADSPAGPRIP